MVVVDVVDPLLQFGVLEALGDRGVKQVQVGVQGELVHGVNAAHVIHHKEQDGCSLSTGTIALQQWGEVRGGAEG